MKERLSTFLAQKHSLFLLLRVCVYSALHKCVGGTVHTLLPGTAVPWVLYFLFDLLGRAFCLRKHCLPF